MKLNGADARVELTETCEETTYESLTLKNNNVLNVFVNEEPFQKVNVFEMDEDFDYDFTTCKVSWTCDDTFRMGCVMPSIIVISTA